MAAIMKTEVLIDSEDISLTRLLKWKITESAGQEVRECIIETTRKIYNDLPDLDSGKTISIKRGYTTSTDQFVFDVYVDRIDKDGAKIIIFGKDKMIDLIRNSVTYSYDGVSFPSTEAKGSDIAKDLIETWGGMTAEVVDTGSVLILDKFICNGVDIFSRLQILADIYDYQIYYDSDDGKVHFEPKGYTSSSESLVVGGASNNVSDVPKWTFDNTQCINTLIVKGAVQEVEDEEFFSGDGSANQVFTLSKQPLVVQMWENVASTWVLKVPGVEDSTSGTYNYTIDKEKKLINCEDSWAPASGTNNVRANYTNAIPVPIQVQDDSSIDKYGVYRSEKYFSDIQDVADAESRGNSWISKHSVPFVQVKLKPVSLIDYDAGTKIQVTDTINNEDRELVINKITKTYPHNVDELECGDKEWILAEWGKFTLERIRRLEEENQKNTDLLIQIRSEEVDITPEAMYLDVQNKSLVNNGFILDNPNNAILDTSRLGSPFQSNGFLLGTIDNGILGTNALGGSFESENLIRRTWFNRIYTEDFRDNDFNGGGTGTWDTVTRTLTL